MNDRLAWTGHSSAARIHHCLAWPSSKLAAGSSKAVEPARSRQWYPRHLLYQT